MQFLWYLDTVGCENLKLTKFLTSANIIIFHIQTHIQKIYMKYDVQHICAYKVVITISLFHFKTLIVIIILHSKDCIRSFSHLVCSLRHVPLIYTPKQSRIWLEFAALLKFDAQTLVWPLSGINHEGMHALTKFACMRLSMFYVSEHLL